MVTLERNLSSNTLNNEDLKAYELELRNSFNRLESLASKQSSYESFCELREQLLENLGFTINNLSTEEQKLPKEFLKIANKYFVKIVCLRD